VPDLNLHVRDKYDENPLIAPMLLECADKQTDDSRNHKFNQVCLKHISSLASVDRIVAKAFSYDLFDLPGVCPFQKC
jgi:hypothetical protein